MARALALAERGWGRVHPNPLVGAVLVRDGRIVGEGWHEELGGPHAETVALQAAGQHARGAHLYVTLEPCAHRGRTPPCTEAILAAGVASVTYGATDPHPEAAGGARVLAENGVSVEGPVATAAVRSQNAPFFHRLGGKGPFLALKLAMSLDGKLGREGEETAVTGEAARAAAHRLRAGFDAILVGGTTARVDDPRLTVRGDVIPRVAPIRAVATASGALNPASQVFAASGPAWVFVPEDANRETIEGLERAGARVIGVRAGGAGLDPEAILRAFEQEGVRTILCEGGGRLGAAFLQAGLVNRLHLFVTPRAFGAEGVPAFPLDGLPGDWTVADLKAHGRDVEISWDRADAQTRESEA